MLKKMTTICFLVSVTINAASFDCSKAESKAEKLICNTPALSQADDALYVDYHQAKISTGNSDGFKALVKQNWKLREKNCDTVECLQGWYRRSSEIYQRIAATRGEGEKVNNTYFYNTSVKFKGTLNREFDGFPSLRLDNLISISPSDDVYDDMEPLEYGIAVMQLAISGKEQWDIFEKSKGKKALVTCNVYHAHTIHHKTPVMCLVEEITPQK
ncbi:DUF4431 domain-containing protein [Xenorhabdus anantnagensis]|uniref:DUF4431 domain-containing protein n=1 Tax=Xenorhabdus anantnagensis TaxID=3025875 RepID=A0ABT5LW95_9GAMM|nr:DUF4431 domain-containing protein [Xenorhabdus anantnagensis]MDC9598725.1 DUF4431 domain-containing protein [Xenorhabdus anantnagensis]